MNITHPTIPTIEEMVLFLKGTNSSDVTCLGTIDERYRWLTAVLTTRRYLLVNRQEKGIIRAYLARCTGYSESHVDHCIRQYRQTGRVIRTPRNCPTEFTSFYTREDIALLAQYTEAMGHQNGKAIISGLKEMYHVYDDIRFERLSHLSVSHFYNLRETVTWQNTVLTYTKTKSTNVQIGERKKPYPVGKPGYIRVDSVHQGDRDKVKGVYHLNLVDEVTQYEVVCAVEGISEYYMEPALTQALLQFPFTILNFHSDNGSEYINATVAKLLETVRVTQTKSRSRRTNDNALVEGKNAAVIRTHYGRAHIPKQYAELMETFNRKYLNPFVNYHRQCAFPREEIDSRGKVKKIYDEYRTPVEKLLTLPKVEQYLRPGVTIEILRQEQQLTDHFTAAKALQKAKQRLFASMK